MTAQIIDNTVNLDNSPLGRLADGSRVWIYQSNRPFSEKESVVLRSQINGFVNDWAAHGKDLLAAGDVLFGQFIVLAVDEAQAGASGCSIDKSVYFVKSLEQQLDVSLFERMNFAFFDAETLKTATAPAFKQLYTEGVVSAETLVFDNLVQTLGALRTSWLKPVKDSWHKRFV